MQHLVEQEDGGISLTLLKERETEVIESIYNEYIDEVFQEES